MKRNGTGKGLRAALLFSVMVLPLIFVGCGGSTSEPVWNISGNWFLYHVVNGVPGDSGPDVFTFSQSNNLLSGTAPGGRTLGGSVNGTDVSFSWTDASNVTYTYSAVLNGSGFMSGTWTSSAGPSGIWHGIIDVAPLANISGQWNIFHVTAGVTGEQGPDVFVFAQTGNDLSGTTSQDLPLKGSIGSLNVTFSWTGNDGRTTIYTGTTTGSGTSMSGTWLDTTGLTGTWTGTKTG